MFKIVNFSLKVVISTYAPNRNKRNEGNVRQSKSIFNYISPSRVRLAVSILCTVTLEHVMFQLPIHTVWKLYNTVYLLYLNWLTNGTGCQLKPYYLYYVSVPFCSQFNFNLLYVLIVMVIGNLIPHSGYMEVNIKIISSLLLPSEQLM